MTQNVSIHRPLRDAKILTYHLVSKSENMKRDKAQYAKELAKLGLDVKDAKDRTTKVVLAKMPWLSTWHAAYVTEMAENRTPEAKKRLVASIAADCTKIVSSEVEKPKIC